MSKYNQKRAKSLSQNFYPVNFPEHKQGCAICASQHLAGGAWIGLPSGLILDLCAACSRRVRSLRPIERADVARELAARYAPDLRCAA